jgi:hypothetical protein
MWTFGTCRCLTPQQTNRRAARPVFLRLYWQTLAFHETLHIAATIVCDVPFDATQHRIPPVRVGNAGRRFSLPVYWTIVQTGRRPLPRVFACL